MNTKVVWELSGEDFKEIEDLYEKKIALENLAKIIDLKDKELYEKIIYDYGKTVRRFNEWWSTMSKKYSWQGENWWVNFETKQVLSND